MHWVSSVISGLQTCSLYNLDCVGRYFQSHNNSFKPLGNSLIGCCLWQNFHRHIPCFLEFKYFGSLFMENEPLSSLAFIILLMIYLCFLKTWILYCHLFLCLSHFALYYLPSREDCHTFLIHENCLRVSCLILCISPDTMTVLGLW